MSANILILRRQGQNVQEIQPNSEEFIFLASAINRAISMMEHPTGRHHLTNLALTLDHRPPGSGRLQGDHNTAAGWVNTFLGRLRQAFPAVVIDNNMANLDLLGTHPRGAWDGNLNDFNTRSQTICIHASVRTPIFHI